MTNNIIEIKDLCKNYINYQNQVVPVIKKINLKIPEGSIYGIIGMSGAGKTTLLRCLTGLEPPSGGEFIFNEESYSYFDKDKLAKLRKEMGMVFQHVQLFSSRTVEENIIFPLEVLGYPVEKQRMRVAELLRLIGLESKRNCYPSQLSGGEKQRVGIARGLATNPRLLLCDEPTSALDPKTTRDLLHLLQQLNKEFGLTIVIITHQLEIVKQICERVAVLDSGQIVEEGWVEDVFTKPQHEITQLLV